MVLENLLQYWFWSLVGSEVRKFFRKTRDFSRKGAFPTHVFFCIVDHFEPKWRNPSYAVANGRVSQWNKRYPEIARRHFDSEGNHPKYTFFYPEEEYEKKHLDQLADICHRGYGEVEVHLHHDNDTPENLRTRLIEFKEILHNGHSLLSTNKKTKELEYAFIHGNWALDNSRKDGRWCGVNNELQILKETGCYADFTLPSAPSETQTRKINSIYTAVDDPEQPKSHDMGVDVIAGKGLDGDLLIVQGPLCFNWRRRKWFVLPRLENAGMMGNYPPTRDRIDLWMKQQIHVKGQASWIFVKVHTHGCQEDNLEMLLGGGLDFMFSYLEDCHNDNTSFFLHYVTAREMYNIIKALAEEPQAEKLDFQRLRNYELVFGQ